MSAQRSIHALAALPTLPTRTPDSIAARNRAWRELRGALGGLPVRWIKSTGEFSK